MIDCNVSFLWEIMEILKNNLIYPIFWDQNMISFTEEVYTSTIRSEEMVSVQYTWFWTALPLTTWWKRDFLDACTVKVSHLTGVTASSLQVSRVQPGQEKANLKVKKHVDRKVIQRQKNIKNMFYLFLIKSKCCDKIKA